MNIDEWQDFISSLLNNTAFGIIALDTGGNFILANNSAMDLLDIKLPADRLYEYNILSCLDHFPALRDNLEKSINRYKKPFEIESEYLKGKYLNIRGRPIQKGYLVITDNITGQKELEANSVLSIITGQENERTRLAREIHDGIGPLLSSAKLELDAFMDEMNESQAGLPYEKLISIREIIDSITNDLRDLSHHLLPRLLDEFGLYSAFNSLINRINNSVKSNIDFYCNFNYETRFNRNIELNLYRCGQELLNNAIKYSGAGEILLQLIKHENSIILMVEDDGIGFDADESDPDQTGIGLINIDTRVRTLDGEFIIDSAKNRGTTASIEIPL